MKVEHLLSLHGAGLESSHSLTHLVCDTGVDITYGVRYLRVMSNARKERQLQKLHSDLTKAVRNRDRYEEERDELRDQMKNAQEGYEFHVIQVEDLEDLIEKVENDG